MLMVMIIYYLYFDILHNLCEYVIDQADPVNTLIEYLIEPSLVQIWLTHLMLCLDTMLQNYIKID